MTDGIAAVVPQAPVRASVKWYDAGSGYGFLAPEDGAGDIFCHATALEAVGLVRLLAGATVFCEVVPGRSGPQVSRIHGVDFRTASSAPLSVDEETGSGHLAPASGSLPAGRRVRALVKWFMPLKGYGFLEPVDGSADLFCHLGVVRAAGLETLPQGAPVSCEAVQGERGPLVSRILSVDAPAAVAGASGRQRDTLRPGRHGTPPPAAGPETQGTVKFYDPVRGFGFIAADEGGHEVFVHYRALSRAGLEILEPGERVRFRIEEVPRGLQASDIAPV